MSDSSHQGARGAYHESGRSRQKARTRAALVEAARALLADGRTPTVEEVAATAGVARTTAYRYFPDRTALVLGAHPETLQRSLLPDDPPEDVERRLDLVLERFAALTLEWEPQLRASLRLSLEPGAERPVLRGGRAVGWIEDALAPLRAAHGDAAVRRLAIAIRSATGIESLVWLTDVAGLSGEEAAATMRATGRALLAAALRGVRGEEGEDGEVVRT